MVSMKNKVVVIGLDCVPPDFVFDRYKNEMPNVRKLMEKSLYGELESSVPPSSANAWLSMTSGKGTDKAMGIYDYIYRVNRSYTDIGLISSKSVKTDRIWDILSKEGKKSLVINVILSYPAQKLNGWMVTGPLTPEKAPYTYPKELQKEMDSAIKKRIMIIPDSIKLERKRLYREIFDLTRLQFRAFKYLLDKKDWDFFIGVIYATDILIHNFWRYLDKEHKKYEENPEMREKVRDYFKYVDSEIGEIISNLDENTTIILMSDHGAKRMNGRVNLNEWLMKEGYLVLKKKPEKEVQIYNAPVDWKKTKAFALGAYYACVFLNVKGRDPQGIVDPGEVGKLKKELKKKIADITDDSGKKMNTKIFDIPEGDNSPDLVVYFDDLHWGTNSTVGNKTLYSWATEKGSDDAIHSSPGFFIIHDKRISGKKRLARRSITDMVPTILKAMDVKIPKDIEGKPINF